MNISFGEVVADGPGWRLIGDSHSIDATATGVTNEEAPLQVDSPKNTKQGVGLVERIVGSPVWAIPLQACQSEVAPCSALTERCEELEKENRDLRDQLRKVCRYIKNLEKEKPVAEKLCQIKGTLSCLEVAKDHYGAVIPVELIEDLKEDEVIYQAKFDKFSFSDLCDEDLRVTPPGSPSAADPSTEDDELADSQ